MDCGGSFPSYVMQFDHRDPTTKVASLARLSSGNFKLETLKAEIEKCDAVCSNCHHIRTHKQQQLQRDANELKHASRPYTAYSIRDKASTERSAKWRAEHPGYTRAYNKANWRKYAPDSKAA